MDGPTAKTQDSRSRRDGAKAMKTRFHKPHSGGAHSIAILKELTSLRIIGAGSPRASRTISELGWERAQSYAIQREEQGDAYRTVWHAGHITAILSNETDVVAATQTGGVWLVNSVLEPEPSAGYVGRVLSDAWDTPDIPCLAWGAGTADVYVGTSSQVLFLQEFAIVLGNHLDPNACTPLALPFTDTIAMVTLKNPDRLVITTSYGVWWSPIPKPASNAAGYHWKPAKSLPSGPTFTGLAAGPSGSVAVAAYGGFPTGLGTPPPGGALFKGTFQAGELVFAPSTIAGIDGSLMRTTSLASCQDQPANMYAVAAGTDDMILAVMASTDGGATWGARTAPDKNVAGYQGSYNNCIAVSPQHPNQVVVGWLTGGAFFSDDGGNSWRHPHTQESNSNLHNDLHAICFCRNGAIFVGGDGGIAVSQDEGITYQSQFNRPLNNLQFYGGSKPAATTHYGATLTASSRYPGLLAGGLQDNGNLYRLPDARRPDSIPRQADTAWFRHVGGDGDLNRFVDPLGALLNIDNTNTQLGLTLWDEAKTRFPPGPGAVIPTDGNAAGVAPTAVDLVQEPAFARAGQLMYAAVGSTDQGVIYGFFADPPTGDAPQADNAKLIRLGSVGNLVTALASLDGSTLMVGTDNGRIVSFDSASGLVSDYALPDQAGGNIVYRIEVFPPTLLSRAMAANAFALVGGRILYFSGFFWATTTGTDWNTFTYHASSGRLFAANDADVFFSTDHGNSWQDSSAGLPARPHCSDLALASDGNGGTDLYLSTYGHSVWRASIEVRSEGLEVPPEVAQVLVGVIGDGGGIVRVGKTFYKVPPRPWYRDMMAALVADATAGLMSEESAVNSRAIQRAALQQIAAIALREVGKLG